MTEPKSDGELIRASLEEPDVFASVFRRYVDDIYRFVSRRVGADDAAELTGDIFVRAFELRHRFDTTRSSARPWLFGIAGNIIGDHLRRADVRRRRFLFGAVRNTTRESDPYRSVDDALDARSVRAEIDRALAGIAADDREALLLSALAGLTYSEISEALDIPIGTVRSRIARARRRLRELLPADAQTTLRVFDEEPS